MRLQYRSFWFSSKISIVLAVILANLVLLNSVNFAQSPQRVVAADSSAITPLKLVPEVKQPLPFGPGESLKYEIKYAKVVLFATVGDITFTISDSKEAAKKDRDGLTSIPTDPKSTETVKDDKTAPGAKNAETVPTEALTAQAGPPAAPLQPERLLIRGEAQSRGALVSLFGFNVKEIMESTVDKRDLHVCNTHEQIEEGRYHHERTSEFAVDKQEVTYIDKDLSSQDAKPKVVTGKIGPWAVDPIAAIYFLRTMNLKVGQTIKLPITSGGKTNELDIIALQKEEISVGAGKFSSLKIEAKAFNGSLFKGDGTMYVWLTDDQYHLPVKFQIKFKYGTVTGNLTAKNGPPAGERKKATS